MLKNAISGYGALEATKLLANTNSADSTRTLIDPVLGLYDDKLRDVAFSALSKRELAGYEKLLADQIEGYGQLQVVQLLGIISTVDSSKILIDRSLGTDDDNIRSKAFAALQKRKLSGLESLLAMRSEGYGRAEAAKLLVQTDTRESSGYLIRKFLQLSDDDIRNLVSAELQNRGRNNNLFGYEKELGAQISGYGARQVVDILALINSPASSQELIDRALDQSSGEIREKAYNALSKRRDDLCTYRQKLEYISKSGGYGKNEADKLLNLLKSNATATTYWSPLSQRS